MNIWHPDADEEQSYPPLTEELVADVAIVGAGITGLATALRLCEAGRAVVVLEAGRSGHGNTGNSTGNLYGTLSQGLAGVQKKWGGRTVADVVALRSRAVDDIEATVHRLGIDCGFVRCPLFFCETGKTTALDIDRELELSAAAGLPCQLDAGPLPLPIPVRRALRIDGQAQLNPFAYAQGLARAVRAAGGLIYEHSRVEQVDARGMLRTSGGSVRATHIVEATHTPLGVNLLQAEMIPYREHGMAAELRSGAIPAGIFWLLDGFHSVRGYRREDRDYVVVVGEKHKLGQGPLDPFGALQDYARHYFAIGDRSYHWSAQQYRAADDLPYIGRSSGGYVATGYAADGLVWGTIAAMLIAERIRGGSLDADPLFAPGRFTPLKSAQQWLEENATVAQHLVKDRIPRNDEDELETLAAGQGKLIQINGESVAAYRSTGDAELCLLSPTCPHLKCNVAWNAADASWDCPCHGSRFRPDGQVIEGPALQGLTPWRRPIQYQHARAAPHDRPRA